MPKKFNKQEKYLIASVEIEKYDSRRCDEHGVYQFLKGTPRADEGKCLYCPTVGPHIENIEELQKQFREELKWFENN